ncbi:Fanconi anemia core complex-associated protein 100 [Plectropomus leopardus]|uniref:Fanconi anemia core complex-associated protein 100 n=1 Tax=Plectropomus leopardus TaxID=160734 RepID=UPI001C4C3A70|nr:Fanconi anemia core complex-associated protein 100 [Plectropomus leopardus]
MEGRCVVETWAEFGFSGTSCSPRVMCGLGTDVFFCTGSEVYVFSAQERKLTAVLQFPGPVSDLADSHDKQLLYVACRTGVYCVSLQLMLSRAQKPPADASSCPPELKISSECLVVAEEGVLSLLLIGSVLLTLSQRGTSWMLTLYKSSNYETLGSFKRVSGIVHNDTEGKTETRRTSVLICVHCSDATPPSSPSTSSSEVTLSDGHFRLEPVLFKLLFGIDAALAKSPVVLCGLPDGCLCFFPLRLPGSRLRVLHSLEQPVVFVGASVITEMSAGHAQCLVAVGEQGRVVLIQTDKAGPEGGGSRTGFIEGCVPGPVMCGYVDKSCLYYSTGSDLLKLDLSEGSSGREGQERDEVTSSKTDAGLQSPTSLNVCRVVALAEPTYNTAAGNVQLLGLSARGQLQMITLPAGKEDARLSKLPSTQVGRSVRDVLSAIGDVCERASALRAAVKSKNQILQHLNQVLNISFLLIANKNGEEHLSIQEKPIRCQGITSWSRLLQKESLNLTCVLDNSSPYILERGWTLSIAVFPLSYPPSAGGQCSSTNFSFPFNNLHPGDTLEVSLPLEAAGDASFPMTVSCSLLFCLTSLLGEEAADLPGLQSSCISLPLNTLTVDWLHALQVNSPISTHQKVTSQPSNTTDTIQAFLRSRGGGKGERGGESSSKPQHSASIRLSTELLRDTLRSSDLDAQGPKLAPQNVCLSLLEWLLSEGPGKVKTGHQGDKIALRSPVVHARCPNGHTVKLTAKEVIIGEESRGEEESLATVELQVESSSIAAVCGLHHAALRRIQTLLHRAPERTAAKNMVQSLSLRQTLQRAEHLLQQIQQSRISGAFGVGDSTGQMTRSLLSVYQELRENPLLII